jgi:hypothetical protein
MVLSHHLDTFDLIPCSRPRWFLSSSVSRPLRNRRLHRSQCDLSIFRWRDRRPDQSRSNLRQVYVRSLLKAAWLTTPVGKTLAYTSINFTNSKGEVFARGSHTKYVALAWKDPNNIVEELSPKKEEKKP